MTTLSIRATHHNAMDMWDNALHQKRVGNLWSAIFYGRRALVYEQDAAERCIKEPSKSILTNSAQAMLDKLGEWLTEMGQKPLTPEAQAWAETRLRELGLL